MMGRRFRVDRGCLQVFCTAGPGLPQTDRIWLYDRYPTYSFYTFDERAVIALYSNAAAKKDLPAFEITRDSLLGQFLWEDMGDLRKECRRRVPEDLEAVIRDATAAHT